MMVWYGIGLDRKGEDMCVGYDVICTYVGSAHSTSCTYISIPISSASYIYVYLALIHAYVGTIFFGLVSSF